MTEVYLALGSNLGDSRQYIADAIKSLKQLLTDVKQAPLYCFKAVGYTDQADFLNTAVSGQTDLSPTDLLQALQGIEQRLGRTKTFRWGPREIDIDLIFYGDTVLKTDQLTLPHPEFRDRVFVLQPLADLKPDLKDPVSGQTVTEMLTEQLKFATITPYAEV